MPYPSPFSSRTRSAMPSTGSRLFRHQSSVRSRAAPCRRSGRRAHMAESPSSKEMVPRSSWIHSMEPKTSCKSGGRSVSGMPSRSRNTAGCQWINTWPMSKIILRIMRPPPLPAAWRTGLSAAPAASGAYPSVPASHPDPGLPRHKPDRG